jgi:Protein of unknown function (DUF1592)/Protein of unknown function (DUF1588)/Protein of unknown function (DUF1595)/Protein of unknown function (DUF1585)
MRNRLSYLLLSGIFSACSGGLDIQLDEGVGAATSGPSGISNSPPKTSSGVPAGATPSAATTAGQAGQPAASQPPPPPPNAEGGQPSGTDYEGDQLYTRFNLLSKEQWATSVKDLLKLSALPDTLGLADAVTTATDFTNNERVLDQFNGTQISAFAKLTEALVKDVATDAGIAKLYQGTDAKAFITAFGRRAYRRPLTAAEITTYQAVFDAGSKLTGTGSAFTKGAGLVIETLLQSPNFLTRIEAGAANSQLDGYEVAAKLSLWLLKTGPDDALLDRAAKLTTPDAIATEAKAMLEKPAAAEVMRTFHAEWLGLAELDDIQKDASLNIPADISAELSDIATKYFDRIFSQNLGLKEILTGTQGYVGPKTATLYGVQATSVVLKDFGPTRTGYFAQVPYNMLFGSYAGQSNPILRGATLQRKVLCGVLPPPDSVFVLPDPLPNQTNRERIETMTESSESCSKCHGQYINPLGYAFENIDGVGRTRATDNGSPLDTTSRYPFPGKTETFTDHATLMQAALKNEMAHVCYAKQLASFGLGRDIVATDEPWLKKLAAVSQADGSMKDVIVALVKDQAFSARAAGTP